MQNLLRFDWLKFFFRIWNDDVWPKLVTERVVLKLKANIFHTKFDIWTIANAHTLFKKILELHFECWKWQICMWQRTLEMYNSSEQYQLKIHYIGWILQSAYMRRISTAFMFIKIAFMHKKKYVSAVRQFDFDMRFLYIYFECIGNNELCSNTLDGIDLISNSIMHA